MTDVDEPSTTEGAATARAVNRERIAEAHVMRRFSADILMLAPETR
jgi:hypothetical protein